MEPALWYLFSRAPDGPPPDPDPEPGDINLSASSSSVNLQINLSWTDEPVGTDSVQVFRALSASGAASATTPVATVGAGIGSWVDDTGDLDDGVTYHYRVDGLDESSVVLASSNTASAVAQIAENFSISATPGPEDSGEITLDTASSPPAGTSVYDTFFRETGVGGGSSFGSGVTMPHTNTVPVLDQSYSFTAVAKDSGGSILGISNEVDATAPSSDPPPPPKPVPEAPTNFAGTTDSSSQIDFTWTAAEAQEGGDPPTGYRLYRNGTVYATLGNVTSHSATGLPEGSVWEWWVVAFNADGESDASNAEFVPTQLAAPTTLVGQQIGGTGSTGFVRLTWTNNSTNAADNVIRRNGVVYQTLNAASDQYDVPNDDADATFTVTATAFSLPDSDPSNEVSPPWVE